MALCRLLQLVSPNLPTGAFSYSQGIECAVEDGWIKDDKDSYDWIHGVMSNSMAYVDVPLYFRLYDAWSDEDDVRIKQYNQMVLACRESRELNDEDQHTALALIRLLKTLHPDEVTRFETFKPLAFLTVYAFVAQYWQIPRREGAQGYLWSWCENQILAATKLVPLGQSAAQAVLYKLANNIPGVIDAADQLDEHGIGASLPGLALASGRHEHMYCRLFSS